MGNALSDGLQHKTPPNHLRSLALPPPRLHWPASLPGGLGLCHIESPMLRGPMKPLFTEQTANGWQGEGTAGGGSTLILWPSASRSLAAPGLTPAPGAGRLASGVSLLARAPYIACACALKPHSSSAQPCSQGSCCPLEAGFLAFAPEPCPCFEEAGEPLSVGQTAPGAREVEAWNGSVPARGTTHQLGTQSPPRWQPGARGGTYTSGWLCHSPARPHM